MVVVVAAAAAIVYVAVVVVPVVAVVVATVLCCCHRLVFYSKHVNLLLLFVFVFRKQACQFCFVIFSKQWFSS
jgi:hypothetical protein